MTYADNYNLRTTSVKFNDVADAIDGTLTRNYAGLTTGTASAYIATPSPAWTSYVTSSFLVITPHIANNASATINVSGLGARNINKNNSPVTAGVFIANVPVLLAFNGVNFEVIINTYTAAEIQNSALIYAGTSTGTNTITASLSPALTAYAAGQRFCFKAGGANTGATTLNLNGVGAAAVQRWGVALVGGEIQTADMVEVIYDGAAFQLVNSTSAPLFVDRTNSRVGINSTAPTDTFTLSNSAQNAVSLVKFGNDTNGHYLSFKKTKGATATTNGIVGNNEELGLIAFYGNNGSGYTAASAIQGVVNGPSGPSGATDMPGELRFYTTPEGTGALVEAMRIAESGKVKIGLGSVTPAADLHVVGASGANAVAHLTTSTSGATSTDGMSLVSEVTTGNSYVINRENAALIFSTNNSEKARINSSGYVGIGTNNPECALHVVGGGAGTPTTAGVHISQTGGYARVELADTTGGYLDFTSAGTDYKGRIIYTHSNNNMQFINNGAATLNALGDNKVSIPIGLAVGTSASPAAGFALDVVGRAQGTVSVNESTWAGLATSGSYIGNGVFSRADRAASSAYDFFVAQSNYSGSADTEFRARGNGDVLCDGAFTGGGADYAEFFEWEDGNPQSQDRRGKSVVLAGDKIKIAQAGDTPIGVISGNPSAVGDAAWNKWSNKFLRDDFGSYVFENYEVWEWEDAETGKRHSYAFDQVPDGVIVPQDKSVVIQSRRTLNPEYDPSQTYVPRANRPEWDPVGLLGKLRVSKGQVVGASWIKLRDISATVEEWLIK